MKVCADSWSPRLLGTRMKVCVCVLACTRMRLVLGFPADARACRQPRVLGLRSPPQVSEQQTLHVVGDLHGQYRDLVHILEAARLRPLRSEGP